MQQNIYLPLNIFLNFSYPLFFLNKRCLMIFQHISFSLLPRCGQVINYGRAATLLCEMFLLVLCMHSSEVLYDGSESRQGDPKKSVTWDLLEVFLKEKECTYCFTFLLSGTWDMIIRALSAILNHNMTLKMGAP